MRKEQEEGDLAPVYADAILAAIIIYLCDRNPDATMEVMEEALLRAIFYAPQFENQGLTAIEAAQEIVAMPRMQRALGIGWPNPRPVFNPASLRAR